MSIVRDVADPPSARRRETRARLLDAAIEVFAEEGLQAASVEAICARAGFTRGAFYSNFESKEQLFLELFERELTRQVTHLETQAVPLIPALREHGNQLDAAAGARLITEFFAPGEDAITWFMLETELFLLATRERSLGARYREFMASFYGNITHAVEMIVAATERSFTIPTERVLPIMVGICEGMLRDAALAGTGPAEAADEFGERLAELIFAITEPVAA